MKYRVKRHAVDQPLNASYRFIPLTQGQNAIVDAADFEWLSQFNWFAQWNICTHSFYAVRDINIPNQRRRIIMAREILSCIKGKEIDHINHDTLDNRRANLRECSDSQNHSNARMRSDNTTGFIGTFKVSKKWRAKIIVRGKRVHLGYFPSAEDAAQAYDAAAIKYHGEFAHLNFPQSSPSSKSSELSSSSASSPSGAVFKS